MTTNSFGETFTGSSYGTDSNPARFGAGQSSADARNLFLKIFGGEVLTAFQERVLTLDKHRVQTIEHGKSAQFPKTWKASSEYHVAGKELLGNDIDTGEVTITVDGLLVSHTEIYDLDRKMAHFDVTSEFSNELGRALAREFDKNSMRTIIRSARTASDGPFPGGNVIEDANLTNTGTISGVDWIDGIVQANQELFEKDVPEDHPRFMLVNKKVFDAIKYAKDASGNYLVLNRDFGTQAGGIAGRGEVLMVDGVAIMAQRTIPGTDESADAGVYPKYRGNYSTTTGVLWTPWALGTVKLMDLAMETERDVRRQTDFMVAKMATGSDPLRPECAVEFRTGAPA
ncbi:phage capsid protein [Roseibium alexandrii]|uniref:Capsid Gp10A/Gp10B-like domain-containing protein n=1 Tax=Roseibium alexandrii (strain DSM 17067 / NCIMB 14079 / DFL-11) TaxID=244592 RepID=A0A5E8GT05_ROSAD|nr:phage capsid protein [Roseibium alexandrii]EEE42846.1 hypothetical protein SADFL11_PLAS18 [Roseibium alexandrii DFL-11]